ncbi:hypothetical protein BBJ28_00012517 [Nothophytophthora sp. Chile5]|nr:hypothetical protein BBJ28_00012517 [Nothophytophthora sp. Chile5]
MTGMTRYVAAADAAVENPKPAPRVVVIIQDPNITQKYQELLRKLESMGGEKIGRHVVHCRLFNRKTLTGACLINQRMFMLRMSQNDDLVYAVLMNEQAKGLAASDNGVEGLSEECSLLECGLDGANILQQVEIYAFKSDGQFEVTAHRHTCTRKQGGTQYAVGDFVVSVCTFMSRNNLPRGLIIEVEYAPCYTVSPVDLLLDEFLSNFAPHERLRKPVDNLPALFEKVGLPPAEYSLKHTALQYVAAFNILRKFDNGVYLTNSKTKRGTLLVIRGFEPAERATMEAGEEEEVATASASLFGGTEDEGNFGIVGIDSSELPPAFTIRLLERPDDDEQEEGDAAHHQSPDEEEEDDGEAQTEDKAEMENAEAPSDEYMDEQTEAEPQEHQDEQQDAAEDASGAATSAREDTDAADKDDSEADAAARRGYQCRFGDCTKFAQAGGLCISHGGGYRCQTPFCPFFNLRTCPDHGGSKRCGITGCTRVALGASALCCAHGGGRKCTVKKCEKYDAGQGFCLAHGGGRDCTVSGCSKKAIRYGLCSGHGGRARCKVEGCTKYDRGQGKCKSHGGGYFCKIQGCSKKDKGGGLCAAHGGGKKCYVEGCATPCVGGGRCKLHGGGKRCQAEGCRSWALNGGRCKEHGGSGKRCSRRGCDKHDQGGGYCLAHGGGFTCTYPECTKKQVQHIRFGRCCAHGGKPRCSVDGCERLGQQRGLCKAHGGSKPCDFPECTRKANSGGHCIRHGGGGRCKAEGCVKTNRGGGYCKAHGGGKKCTAPDCNEWAIGGGVCTQHVIFGAAVGVASV